MAINYFSQLGFDRGGEQFLRAAQGAQGIRANEQAMQINQQNMQRQQQAEQQAMLQFQNEQQRARAAQGAGAFYNALNSGNTQAALQIAQQYQDDINSLGDPTFTVETVSQMMQTPEGIEQLKQMALGTTQLAAGPEQMARFSAQQADPGRQTAPTSVQEQQYYQQLLKTDPAAAEAYGRKAGFIETGREQAKTEAERNLERYKLLKEQDPKLAKQFGQQVGLVSREGKELSANAQKRLSTFIDSSVESGRLEQKYMTLADEFSKSGIQGGFLGVGGTWRETLKDVSGEQDAITSLRKEFLKVRGSEVVSNLPPGAASDADVALALAGFPTERSNGEQVASFLRGIAKLKGFEKRFNEFKANYISENGTERGMLQAWKESVPARVRTEAEIMAEYGLQ